MDDRDYVAQALLDSLRSHGTAFALLGPDAVPGVLELALERATIARVPRFLARFSQDFDLRLVELERPQLGAWDCTLAWGDQLGHPRFISVRLVGDYWRGLRRYLCAEELVSGSADVRFAYGLIEAVERQILTEERAAWLSALWQEDGAAALEMLRRFWRDAQSERLLAQAARSGSWSAVRGALPLLRRRLRRAAPLRLALPPRLLRRRPKIAFTGRESALRASLMGHVRSRLAPLGLEVFEGDARGANFRVVFDAPEELGRELDNVVAIGKGQTLGAMVAAAEGAILRWLECRVERRYPAAMVGDNPLSARLLQLALRAGVGAPLELLLHCRIGARLRAPVLMPVPYGIVLERGVEIGRRVTLMHQVTLGRKEGVTGAGDGGGVPIVEDNVFIGAGAKVLGRVRIGRGATVGANAVVTRDVPSHCTVVGANRILGASRAVAGERRERPDTVVNM
ncbi:MAG TPA: serine acetyltransferase [Burkholderiales bacterium]